MSFCVALVLLLVLLVRPCLVRYDHTSINTLSSALLFVLCVAIRLLSFASSLYCRCRSLSLLASLPCLLSGKVNSYQNQNDLNRTNKNIFIFVNSPNIFIILKLSNIVFPYVVYSALIL